ncbi:hypothetical protein HDU93_005978 [Gonapodya sp. JEL0774]|nr:hypothetical protein HDU93_005978 [Gonapodya sp. JEL0774]
MPPASSTHFRPRPSAHHSSLNSAWLLGLALAALLAAFLTRPDVSSFRAYAKAQVADKESYMSRNLNLTPRLINGAAD